MSRRLHELTYGGGRDPLSHPCYSSSLFLHLLLVFHHLEKSCIVAGIYVDVNATLSATSPHASLGTFLLSSNEEGIVSQPAARQHIPPVADRRF